MLNIRKIKVQNIVKWLDSENRSARYSNKDLQSNKNIYNYYNSFDNNE
jgi:hypothetical protein